MPTISRQQPNRPTTPANRKSPTQTNRPARKPGTDPATGNVLSRVGPIGFDTREGIKLLLYGRSGTGKTTLWATFPKRILAIICSGSDKPGELRSIDTPEYRGTIDQVVLQTSDELRQVVEALHSGDLSYETVVLDHCSGFQDMVLKDILGLDKIPEQKGWGLASQQTYGQCTAQCKEYFRGLLGLPCNVVLVAQERNFNEESESDLIAPTVGAAMTPSLTGWLNPACDYIVQMFKREQQEEKQTKIGDKTITRREGTGVIEYCLRTGPHAVYQTKFRVPKGTPLPDAIVDPDYNDIIALIRGEGETTEEE